MRTLSEGEGISFTGSHGQRQGMSGSRRPLAIVGILLLAAALRFVAIGQQSLWLDEILSLDSAAQPWSAVVFEPDGHPPLYHLLVKATGYWWPSDEPARSYVLSGHPAIAAWATAGSGRSLLYTFTTWQDPPALDNPTTTVLHDGKTYDVWTEAGHIRQIAWRQGPTRAWITNTLLDELTNTQMIGLAASCKPVATS